MSQCADVRALGEFAACHHGTFHIDEAAANGVSSKVVARLVRDGSVVRVRAGVYRFTAATRTWRSDAYAATVGLRAVASRFTAGWLHGLDGISHPPLLPDVLCHHLHPVELSNANVHRSRSVPNADVTKLDGIPCTTIARTIIDLGPLVSPRTRVRLIDDAQRRGVPMEHVLERAERLVACGRSGPRDVMDVVRRRLDGYVVPESYFERLIAECLRSTGLVGVERQHELRTEGGLFVARFDLAIPWVRLGIECHSRSFHLGEAVERYDEDRDIRAAQQGWEITYLGFAATRSPRAVRREIELIVERRAGDLGLRPDAGDLGPLWVPGEPSLGR